MTTSATNPVLILSFNGLPYLRRCIDSVRAQDLPVLIYVIDNGSVDGSREWLQAECAKESRDRFLFHANPENEGVSRGWNCGLDYLFARGGRADAQDEYDYEHEHVLVLNQDVVLPTNFYRELLSFDVPFITGFPTISLDSAAPQITNRSLAPHPCYSAFLVHRLCWEKVGPFDERFFAWAGDCDHHVRCHAAGLGAFKANIPFAHFPGTTIRTTPNGERQKLAERAHLDREAFREKYGCIPGAPEYGLLFAPELFGKGK